MVRINIIDPKKLADQHLIAEYNEILMLLGHVRKHPEIKEQPLAYCLGKGHISFFKDKLLYLSNRHKKIKKEMSKRGFKTTKEISLVEFPNRIKNDWKPTSKDIDKIIERLVEKIKSKPKYYRYYGENKPALFFLDLLK